MPFSSMATGPRSPHMWRMQKTHPHAEATYRVIPLDEGSFGVEVKIPETYPTIVSKFATEADAETWITDHQRRVQSHTQSRRSFTKPVVAMNRHRRVDCRYHRRPRAASNSEPIQCRQGPCDKIGLETSPSALTKSPPLLIPGAGLE